MFDVGRHLVLHSAQRQVHLSIGLRAPAGIDFRGALAPLLYDGSSTGQHVSAEGTMISQEERLVFGVYLLNELAFVHS
jgi:hypothetical protein